MYDRRLTIGASDAVHIQHGQWAELWDRKQSRDEPDFGLPAELGKVLEPFNLELFARETGSQLLIRPEWADDPIRMPDDPWCVYTPDALMDPGPGEPGKVKARSKYSIPVEAKAVMMMWQRPNLLAKYMPQLQHAMRVMKAPYCYFSVIRLNMEYYIEKIPYDPPYDDALLEKERLFMWFLENDERPPEKKGRNWI